MEMTRVRGLAAVLTLCAIFAAAGFLVSAADGNSYAITVLVSDQIGVAPNQDLNLVNAWGLDATATSPWWVADNGANVATIYRANGSKVALTVNVNNAPTGLVANTTTSFVVKSGTMMGAARFIFSTEEGKILGWNPAVSPAAVVAVDNTGAGAVYKGLAIATTAPGGPFLYATDFHNGRVDVFDGNFKPVPSATFADEHIHTGYAPFGIQTVGTSIIVTYAKQDDAAHDDVPGQGHGFVNMFDRSGNLIVRVANHGQLNSPWGIAMAPPAGFGAFSGHLLIGNFGDGEISAFQPQPDGTFELVGQLRGADHKVLSIPGLWSLQFGHGNLANNGPTTTLFFTAGPDGEQHGLFGTITAQ